MSLLGLLLFIGRIIVFNADISLKDIVWVVSNQVGESYPQACLRKQLVTLPVDRNYFAWNESTFNHVVNNILGMQSSKKNYGLDGCCATGLWCFSNDTCFTQGYGPNFSNYGWLLSDKAAARPIYSCIDISVVDASAGSVGDVSVSGMKVIFNSSVATFSQASTAYINGNTCDYVEVCNSVTCKSDLDCPTSYMCYRNFCARICADNIVGGDMSCACNYECVSPQVGSSVGVCWPRHFTSNMEGSMLMCSSSSLVDASHIGSNQMISVLSVVTDEHVDDIAVDKGLLTYCRSDLDCHDGNVCTEDSCVGYGGYCNYAYLPACDSMAPAIRARTTTFSYYNFYSTREAITEQQTTAVSFLLSNGHFSPTSNVDDEPAQAVKLPFRFVFFNSIASEVYISANGMIILPPHDVGRWWMYNLGSGSNIVAPYCADWNPSQLSASVIRYYFQTRGDPSATQLFGVDANVFHVLYYDVTIFKIPSIHATFISSMYSDGSVRFSYVDVSDDIPYLFIGLWGAYSSNAKNSYHRYKAEIVPQSLVVDGSELVFCPVNVTVCPIETCLSPGDNLVLHWDGSLSCDAFGMDFRFRLMCSWAGGINRTEAMHSTELQNITCPVPQLTGFEHAGAVVQVDVLLVRSDGSDNAEYHQNVIDATYLDKSFYVNHLSGDQLSNNLSRSTVYIRYFPNVNDRVSCGCNAFVKNLTAKSSCNHMGICGGGNDNAFLDCAGTLFGSAVETTCEKDCTGGFSMHKADFSCFTLSLSNGVLDIFSDVILLLFSTCFLCFFTISVIKNIVYYRMRTDDEVQAQNPFVLDMTLQEQDGRTSMSGMSLFERNALGSVVFSNELGRELRAQNEIAEGMSIERTGQSESNVIQLSFECSICLSIIDEGHLCRRLPDPCGHLFHIACIDEWLKQSVFCPLCKRSMVHLLVGNDEPSGSNDDVRSHQRFLQLIRSAEDNDVEQFVRFSANPSGQLNPYFSRTGSSETGSYDGISVADNSTTQHATDHTNYVSLRATVRNMQRYRRYMLQASRVSDDELSDG